MYACRQKNRNSIWIRFVSLFVAALFVFVLFIPSSTRGAAEATVKCSSISAGRDHSIALMEDGTLWVWGGNGNGQLGTGDKADIDFPAPLDTINGVKAVAASIEYTVALKKDGTVWAWGMNEYGQLGNGSISDSLKPVQVSRLTNMDAIAAGGTHAVALGKDGTVWAWGRNYYGQLGTTTPDKVQNTPVKVSGISNVKAITAGERHTLALKSDGTVWAWGDNESYQLGVSGYEDSKIPVQVSGLSNIVAISAGTYHSVAIKDDGSVYVWGYNASGQLGTGTIKDSKTPVKLASLTNIKSAAAGNSHTLFLKGDGTVWAAGYNLKGQLGTGNKEESATPVKIEAMSDIASISSKDSHSLAIKKDGTVLAWGNNVYGQIGDGSYDHALIPMEIITTQPATHEPLTVNLRAVPGKNSIVLNWDSRSASDVAGYRIYRAKASGRYELPRTDFMVTGNSFTDNDVEKGVTYYYMVKAILNNGETGTSSNEVSAMAATEEIPVPEAAQKVTIILQLGNPMMKVNGVEKEVDPGKGTAPAEISGRTMIPIRTVVEELGGNLQWVDAEQKIIIHWGDKTLELWLDKKVIKVNGVQNEMDVAPQIRNDRTMVPVRFVTANLNCELAWNDIDKKVTITATRKGTNANETSSAASIPYWVENGNKLVRGNDVVFEDMDGIYDPIFSRDGKYVLYSCGGSELFIYSLDNKEKRTVYELEGTESWSYRVYPVGWSPDNKKIALLTSHSGGFIGGNQLITVDLESGTSTVVTKTLESADWSKNGQFVVADSSEVKILDASGKVVKKLKTPQMRAFFNASNPAFSPDGRFIVYHCGESYYLHDIEKDEYKKLFTVRTADGAARISEDGKIIVADKEDIFIYNPSDSSYKVYYDKAKSSSPNWCTP